MRILLIIAIITAILLVVKLLIRLYTSPFSPKNTDNAQKMVRCAKCNIYLAEKDCFKYDGKKYCSKKHSH